MYELSYIMAFGPNTLDASVGPRQVSAAPPPSVNGGARRG
jgi:hypothetical protein